MGLVTIIKYFDGKEFTSELPLELSVELFEKNVNIGQYNIVGFEINKYNDTYFISFGGRAYNSIINKITGYKLYDDLGCNELKIMHTKLNNFIESIDDIELIQTTYDNSCYCLNSWIERLTNEYVPSPNEIIGLKELFKICYENKLMLYASY